MRAKPLPYRILPDDVYFTLQLMALAFGGIGAGAYTRDASDTVMSNATRDGSTPCCVFGMTFAQDLPDEERNGMLTHNSFEMSWALRFAGLTEPVNDMAVRAINDRRFVPHGGLPRAERDARVPFAAWCRELRVLPESDRRAVAQLARGVSHA